MSQQPQWSADRQWWWDGQNWVPAAQAPVQASPSFSPPQLAPRKKGHMGRNALIALGVLVVAGIGISLANNGANNSKLAANTGNTSQPQATTTAKATATAAATAKATATAAATAKAAPTPAGPTLTNQQQNAARSARQYLDISAFSRLGLIDQLSSSYGEGYAVQDATVAVDSLNVDWNAEAVQSAEAYLKISPFSCNGLIQQLDSAAGEKFTVAQATYGAKQAGAC